MLLDMALAFLDRAPEARVGGRCQTFLLARLRTPLLLSTALFCLNLAEGKNTLILSA